MCISNYMLGLAMIDSGAGAAGGILAFCLFVVGPIALVLHLLIRRFFVVTLIVSAAFTLFELSLWIYFNASVPGRRWLSFQLVWFGMIISLIVSMVAGIPSLLLGLYYNRGENRDRLA